MLQSLLSRASKKLRTCSRPSEKEMDRTLGDLTEAHNFGPMMPRLTPVKPEVEAEDLVCRTLTAEGLRPVKWRWVHPRTETVPTRRVGNVR